MPFTRITKTAEIDKILRGYMFEIEKQKCSFIPNLLTYQFRPGGNFYEGIRPTSCSVDEYGKRTYSFANGDSNYQTSIISIDLDKIEYIELLNI